MGSPGIQITRPGGGNPGDLGALIHNPVLLIQDTGYNIIQDTGIKGCKCKDRRIHGIKDTGYSKVLAAWWPLYRGGRRILFCARSTKIDMFLSGSNSFEVLRLPKETTRGDLHFGSGHLAQSRFPDKLLMVTNYNSPNSTFA